MNCDAFLEGFSDYVDGEVTEAQSQAIEEHLAACPECRRYEEVYRRGVSLLKSFGTVGLDEDFENRLETRLRRDTSEALRHLGRRTPQSGTSMAMVLGVAVILVGVAWSPFVFVQRIAQVRMDPIVARSPVPPFAVNLPGIELMPASARRADRTLPAAALWSEPQTLFHEYAPVMRSYQASTRSGLD